ncbi:hypothetical protein AAHC03_021025 [Spirometra sp. Aus1]
MTNTEALMTWARERFLRTKQKLKRTMISSADWPPPNLIYSSSVTGHLRTLDVQHGKIKRPSHVETGCSSTGVEHQSGRARGHSSRVFLDETSLGRSVSANVEKGREFHEDSGLQGQQHPKAKKKSVDEMKDEEDEEDCSHRWLGSCCWRERSERRQSHRLSSMLSGTYKIQRNHHSARTPHTSTQLRLKTGPDGSLICEDNVDINTLIAGFREFEKHFQYGALMPFVNVLPTQLGPTAEDCSLQEATEDTEVSESSVQELVQPKSLCRTRRTPSKDKRVSFAGLRSIEVDYV